MKLSHKTVFMEYGENGYQQNLSILGFDPWTNSLGRNLQGL
jgi:hypothetical protein